MKTEFLQELAATWNVFFVRKFPSDDTLPSAGLFVLPGFMIGVLFALAGWIASVLFGNFSAGLFAAILFPLCYELLTDWKGLKTLTSFLELRLGKHSPLEALTAKVEPERKLTPIFIFGSLYLLRILAFGRIVFLSPVLLIFIFTGAYFIRGELAACSGEDTEPLLEIPERQHARTYLLTGLLFLIPALLTFHIRSIAGAILIAVATLLIAFYQKKEIRKHTGRAVLRQIQIYGYGAEMILFYIGITVL